MLNMERHHIAIVFNGCSVQSCSILALDVLLVDAGYRRLGVEISVRPATSRQGKMLILVMCGNVVSIGEYVQH